MKYKNSNKFIYIPFGLALKLCLHVMKTEKKENWANVVIKFPLDELTEEKSVEQIMGVENV